jgi:DNA-binding HxlR family transcriptional regulator
MEGPKRFGELKRRLAAISTKILNVRLRMLEAEGWVTRGLQTHHPAGGHLHHNQTSAEVRWSHDGTRPDR